VTTEALRWRATLPAGWAPHVAGRFVVLARAPLAGGPVETHLSLARDELPAGVPLDVLAARSVAAVAEIGDDLAVFASPSATTAGVERCARVVTFTERRSRVDVAQVLAFVAPHGADERGRRDVVQFVGTCAMDELPLVAGTFAAVVESVALGTPS
jgi:hypothetical protein